jgi:hypothetical protein
LYELPLIKGLENMKGIYVIPLSGNLLEVIHLGEKLPALFHTQRFIIVFTKARHWIRS